MNKRRLIAAASRRSSLTQGQTREALKAILEVMSSTELADTLIQRGVQRVEDYTWDRLARRLEAVYQASLRGNHAGKH